MLAGSQAAKNKFDFTIGDWALLLERIADEESIDDLIVVLNEEQEMYLGVDKETSRKKENNKARLKQRVEKIKMEAVNLNKQ